MNLNIAVSPQEYRRRIRAWTMYDWANSAFATTILAAVLPIYFSRVAGATLPSAARATAVWSTGLSISLLIVAVLAPILGTMADVMQGKKRFLAFFAGVGIISTALLVAVDTGDWVLASILAILGRIGFNGSLTFYDALLPHVARPEDRDRVSAQGYAMGYLGGGLLLAVNVVMIQFIPGTWGARLSFLSVALWWAVFTLPILLRVPEPPAAEERGVRQAGIVRASFQRLAATFRDLRQYRELFKFLLAFLIYNDGIGTIIGVAAIYGTELGFGSSELILALLLVQFVGIPYSLIFGRLPSSGDRRRPMYLAFILFNLVALPLAGIIASRALPAELIGSQPERFASTATAYGEGSYTPADGSIRFEGGWDSFVASARETGGDRDVPYARTSEALARYDFSFYGQQVEITYSVGPDYGKWQVLLDGQPVLDEESGQPLVIDAYHPVVRYGETLVVPPAAAPVGEHRLQVVNLGEQNPASKGMVMTLAAIEVLPAIRQSHLGVILGLILALESVGLALAWGLAPLCEGLARKFDTQRSVLLSLLIYTVIAIWGFFLNSVVEFWLLAWMVAIVQGGSQALSRSLYAAMSPAAKSGEFFGLFGIMEKFSSLIGPLLFAAAGFWFGSSRPAVLSLVILFAIGGLILARVNVAEGKRVAQEENGEIV